MKTYIHPLILGTLIFAIGILPAVAQEQQHGHLYAGVGVGSLNYESYYNGVTFGDRSTGMDVYGGYRLRGILAIELALERFDHLDAHDIAGSGTERLNVSGELDAATIRAVAMIPVSDYFHWRRHLELLAAMGYGQTKLQRNVVELGYGPLDPLPERRRGTTLGMGVLYGLRKINLRGYFERLDTNHDRSPTALDLAVEFRF